MNLIELDQAPCKLRLSGMANLLDTRLHQAQREQRAPIDPVATLVSDKRQQRQDRLLHHPHILKCGPRSWRTKIHTSLRTHDTMR